MSVHTAGNRNSNQPSHPRPVLLINSMLYWTILPWVRTPKTHQTQIAIRDLDTCPSEHPSWPWSLQEMVDTQKASPFTFTPITATNPKKTLGIWNLSLRLRRFPLIYHFQGEKHSSSIPSLGWCISSTTYKCRQVESKSNSNTETECNLKKRSHFLLWNSEAETLFTGFHAEYF
jgi:hypothetical protein